MKILFNDILQTSSLPYVLKTGALAERYNMDVGEHGFTVNLPYPKYIDCIGIGYTDATYFKFSFTAFEGWILDGKNAFAGMSDFEYMFNGMNAFQPDYEYLLNSNNDISYSESFEEIIYYTENGLYLLQKPIVTQQFTILTDAKYIGRIGAGRAIKLGTALAKEPAYNNSAKPRATLSGQIIQGAGGYSYRSVSLDTRYKIGFNEMAEIKAAYPAQTCPGLPFFLLFDDEVRRLPFSRLYASDTKNYGLSFESGIHNKFLFSRKFEFEERF
ncbi:MAG: hypothetical protein LBB22_01195 [Treponema sp.]|jgi:hypothetical protein|nr:hypothetical protein [Treponema sp.]